MTKTNTLKDGGILKMLYDHRSLVIPFNNGLQMCFRQFGETFELQIIYFSSALLLKAHSKAKFVSMI